VRPVTVAVVDYGAGNLVSIEQALAIAGAQAVIARREADMARADALVVPGVGAAAPAIARIRRRGLEDPIRDWIASDRPFLGICLGLQLLFEGSDEDGAETLGILPGRTVRLVDAPRLPHIGWNQVERTREHPLFDGIGPDADFYFVHSYAAAPADSAPADSAPADSAPADSAPAGSARAETALTLARTTHGAPFVSAVARGSLAGVQFHPERSGRDGLRLLANFVGIVAVARARAA
jgi:imidazole glycerol phosphate synthase glutamine amidotransferase subunit